MNRSQWLSLMPVSCVSLEPFKTAAGCRDRFYIIQGNSGLKKKPPNGNSFSGLDNIAVIRRSLCFASGTLNSLSTDCSASRGSFPLNEKYAAEPGIGADLFAILPVKIPLVPD